jgi:predicted permease
MADPNRFRRFLRSLLSRMTVDVEVERELAFHVEMRTRELMTRGMEEQEARDAAVARFGDLAEVGRRCRRIARGRDRDLLWYLWLQQLRQDLVFAVRQLRKAPVLSAVVVLTIALAIGANTTVFSVSKAVVLEPLPYPQPERLVRIQETTPEGEPFSVSAPTFIDVREQSRSFIDLAAVSGPPRSFTLLDTGEPEGCSAIEATGSLFAVLGVEPVLGRSFAPEEELPGGDSHVVILSHGLWQRSFGADPEVVGRTITLDGEGWIVVGVLPTGFECPPSPDVWVPFAPDPASERGEHRLEVFGRLESRVSMEQARAELAAIAGRLGELYPDTNGGWGFLLRSFSDWLIGPRARQATLVLTAAVVLMLLLACANVSNLMIVQVTTRLQEFGTRAALGASRGRIVRQLLTESMLLSLAGAAVGLVLAVWATSAIRAFAPDALPRLGGIAIDTGVLLFTLVVALAAGALSGIAPILQITGGRPAVALTSHRHTATRSVRRFQDALVASELSLALMLLIGAGLLVRSFAQLNLIDPGFSAEQVLTAPLTLPTSRYPELSPQVAEFFRQVTEEVEAIPGVTSAGATMVDPFRGPRPSNKVAVDTAQDVGEFVRCQFRIVSPGFFRAMGIPLLRGRTFDATDLVITEEGQPAMVAVISAALADRVWPGEDPVGRRLRWNNPGGPLAEVVGVVGEVRDTFLEADPPPMVYLDHEQLPWPAMTLVVKAESDPALVSGAVRQAIGRIDDSLAVPEIGLLNRNLSEAMAGPLLNTQLLGIFAAVALVIAATGVYGVISYRVARRCRDFGIRMALGACYQDLVLLVLRQGLRLVALGVSLGVLGAIVLTRFLESVLYETSPTDPATFAAVVLVFTVVAAVACYLPARRAAKVDPAVALRAE